MAERKSLSARLFTTATAKRADHHEGNPSAVGLPDWAELNEAQPRCVCVSGHAPVQTGLLRRCSYDYYPQCGKHTAM